MFEKYIYYYLLIIDLITELINVHYCHRSHQALRMRAFLFQLQKKADLENEKKNYGLAYQIITI